MEKINEEEILVSVCCLAYNHEKYIRNALEGFVHQKTNFKYEVLIHDDASSDGTPDIIREYEEKYPDLIKPIYQKENQMSQGIRIGPIYQYPRAKGKYICWCEGDDYWCDEYKLQKQFDAMQENPECTICVHKVACINEDGTPNGRIIPEDYYGFCEGRQTRNKMCQAFWIDGWYPFHTCSYFVRKEVLTYIDDNRASFNYFHGDINFLRASFILGDFYYIDEVMSIRRLFSIGGINYTIRTWDNQKKIEFMKNRIRGELKFNEHTGGVYDKYIKVYCASCALDWCMIDPEEAKQMLDMADISWENVRGIKSRKKKIYYLSLRYCIPAFKVIQVLWRVKHKLENARQ